MKYFHKKHRDLLGHAEEMYIVKGMGIPEIASILKICSKVLYDWRKTESWDEKRTQHRNVFRSTLLALENKLESIAKDMDKLSLADNEFASKCDAISKLLGQIVKLRNHYEQDQLKMTVDIMTQFAIYVRKLDLPEDRVEVVELAMEGFFKEQRKKSA